MTTALVKVKPDDLPAEARQDSVAFLGHLDLTLASVSDMQTLQHRLALIDAVKAYQSRFGKQAEPVIRAAVAVRLAHERRLGELLAETVAHGGGGDRRSEAARTETTVFPDDSDLPDGISRDLSSHAQALARAPADWFEETVEGVKDGTRRKAVKEIYLEARRVAAAENPPELPEHLVHGDFCEVGQALPDACAALVFTDPPYDRASIPLYAAAAEFAARVLLPGGSFVAYAPTYALPEVFTAIGKRLRYWWTLAVVHSGGRALMMEYGVRVAYKPLIWYVKGGRHDKQAIFEDIIMGTQEKTDHEWQQSVAEAEAVIRLLTKPGDLIVDPMAGSCTTLIAAETCGRRWWGADKDAGALATGKSRLTEAQSKL